MICPPPLRPFWGLLALTGLCVGMGCGKVERDPSPGGSHEGEEPNTPSPNDDDEPPDNGDPPDDDDPPEDPPGDGECPDTSDGETSLASPLDVPAQIPEDPVETFVYESGILLGDSGPIEIPVTFDLGADAAESLSLKLGTVYDLECGALDGSFIVDSIEVLEGTAEVAQTDEPGVVTLRAEEAGGSVIEVRGVLSGEYDGACDVPAEVPVVYSLVVQAEDFEWIIATQSTCPHSIASGREFPLRVVAPDSGSDFSRPMNLVRPALSISTSSGVELQTFDSSAVFYAPFMPSVTAVGSGTVTVAFADGSSSVELAVLSAEELDDVHLEFALSGVVARGDLDLEPGGSQAFTGDEPKLDVYARWAGAEGAWICGAPDANDFFITSLTPEVCPVEGRFCEPQEANVRGNLLYDWVSVVANGTCTIRIDAPAYAGGAGFSQEFSVELENQDFAED